MAITWEVTITPINIAEKRVSVLAVRVDDVLLTTNSYRIDHAIIDTVAQKIAVLDGIWEQHLNRTYYDGVVTTVIGDLEQDAKTNLEGREV